VLIRANVRQAVSRTPGRKRRPPFLLLILYIAGVSSINYGQDRYRVVVMPLLCMYAGAGYPGLLNYLKTLKWWAKKAG
jgi:hypothetical protein